MLRIIFYVLILFFPLFSQALTDEKIVVIVNKDIITNGDISNRMNFINSLNKNQKIDEKRFRALIINNLIEEKLIEQEAKKYQISVNDQEVEAKIKEIEMSNNQAQGHFLAHFKSLNVEKQIVYDYLKSKLFVEKLVNERLFPGIKISDKELEEVLSTIIPDHAVVEFKQIIVPAKLIDNDKKEEEYSEKMRDLSSNIRKCSDIDQISKNYNVEVMEQNLPINNIHPELRSMIRNLPIGKPSTVIKSNSGLQVLVICNRDYVGLDDKEKQVVKNGLVDQKLEKQTLHYINKLKQKSFIEIKE